MAALAQSVLLKENESKNLLVAIDAKMEQIYWAFIALIVRVMSN